MRVRISLTEDQQDAIRRLTGRHVEIATVLVNDLDGAPAVPYLPEEISLPMEEFSLPFMGS